MTRRHATLALLMNWAGVATADRAGQVAIMEPRTRHSVTFTLTGLSEIRVVLDNETIALSPRDVFEALKGEPR